VGEGSTPVLSGNGILWVLRTGAPWADVPEVIRCTKPAIALQQWVRSFEREVRGVLDLEEAFVSFAPAKK